MCNLKKVAWAYAWAGVFTGMHIQVYVCMYLQGTQSLAHCVEAFFNECFKILAQSYKIFRHLNLLT